MIDKQKFLKLMGGLLALLLLVTVPVLAETVTNNTNIGSSKVLPYAGDGISDDVGASTVLTDEDNTITNNANIYAQDRGVATTKGNVTNNGTIYSIDDAAVETGDSKNILTNDGKIEVENSANSGIDLGKGDDTLTNTGDITIINATNNGIGLNSGNDILTNSGTISVVAACRGIWTGAGNDILTNSGTINIGTVNNAGIAMCSGAVSIVNTGRIEVQDAGCTAISMGDDSLSDSLDNAGTIHVVKADYGIWFSSGNDVLTNSGTINLGLINYAAIAMCTGNDTLINSGAIDINWSNCGISMGGGDGNDTLTNTGKIDIGWADHHGIKTGGGNDTITNSGSINISAYCSGIAMSSGVDTLTNSGTINISAQCNDGLSFGSGTNDLLDNTGTITIKTAGHHGIHFQDGATLTNTGTINIDFACNTAMAFGSGKDTLNNSGTINIGRADNNQGISFGSGTVATLNNSGAINIRWVNHHAIFFGYGDGPDTLTNSGTIDIDWACNAGIAMGSGNDTLNNSGTINIGTTECNQGISMGNGGNDRLENSGDITIGTVGHHGINFKEGGTLINSGTIDIDWVCNTGFAFGSGRDIFNNSGTIRIGQSYDGAGFSFGSGDDPTTFTNSGLITIGSVYHHGIWMGSDSGNDTLNNSGTITIDWACNSGIAMGSGSDTLTNSGTITIRKAECNYGISMAYGDNDTLDNSGDITIGFAGKHGIGFKEDGNLNNSGTIDINFACNTGIAMGSGNGTLDNSGTIDIGMACCNQGISFGSGASGDRRTLINSGTITIGSVNNHHAIWFGSGYGEDTLTNSGTIDIGYAYNSGIDMGSDDDNLDNFGTIIIGSAANDHGISMGDGDDKLTNSGTITVGYAYYGGLNMGGGNDTMTSSGALNFGLGVALLGGSGTDTLNLEGDQSRTFNGDVDEFELLHKKGTGSWTLNGSVAVDDTVEVESGLLAVNGPMTDVSSGALVVNVDAGGTLGGTGDITATVNNSGTVAPGNSVGTLNITGDYNQASGAALDIEVGEYTSDMLVVSGTATLDGRVNAIPVAPILDNSTYTVLTAGTLTNTFSGDADESYVLDFTPTYDTINNVVTLTAHRTPYNVAYPGQAGMGRTLNREIENGNSNSSLTDIIVALDNASSQAELGAILNGLAPSPGANLSDIAFSSLGQDQTQIAGRLGILNLASRSDAAAMACMTDAGPVVASMPADNSMGMGLWVEGFGVSGDQDKDGIFAGYDYDTKGITLGLDKALTDNMILGVSASMTDSDVDYDNNTANHDIDTTVFNIYGAYLMDNISINSVLSYADNDYDSTRTAPVIGLLSSDHNATDMGVSVSAGYQMNMGGLNVIPTAGLEYALHDEDGYTEYTSTGAAFLQTDDADTDSLKSRLGVNVNRLFAVSDTMQLMGQMRLQYAHEFADTEREVTARFTGTTGSFTVKGLEPERDSLGCGLDLVLSLNQALKLNLSGDGEWRDGFTAYGLSGGVRYDF